MAVRPDCIESIWQATVFGGHKPDHEDGPAIAGVSRIRGPADGSGGGCLTAGSGVGHLRDLEGV